MALEARDYQHVRENLLPIAPVPLSGCLGRELEFGMRKCLGAEASALFPIRFLWAMDGVEQRQFDLPAGRSRYHPGSILENWEKVVDSVEFREELSSQGFQLDLDEKAIELSAGWIYIGDSFVEDFLEIESVVGVELVFPGPSSDERRPAFVDLKRELAEAGRRDR